MENRANSEVKIEAASDGTPIMVFKKQQEASSRRRKDARTRAVLGDSVDFDGYTENPDVGMINVGQEAHAKRWLSIDGSMQKM